MSKRKKPRGRPPKQVFPEFKERADGLKITPETLAQSFLRLPEDYEWEYLKNTHKTDDEIVI